MNSNGRPAEARRVLERALDHWPYERDLLFALATMQRDAGQLEAARQTIERMVQAHPEDFAARAPSTTAMVRTGGESPHPRASTASAGLLRSTAATVLPGWGTQAREAHKDF
jgi:predicted TPR repeat methyltransferase